MEQIILPGLLASCTYYLFMMSYDGHAQAHVFVSTVVYPIQTARYCITLFFINFMNYHPIILKRVVDILVYLTNHICLLCLCSVAFSHFTGRLTFSNGCLRADIIITQFNDTFVFNGSCLNNVVRLCS